MTPSPAATAAPPAEKHLRVAPAVMAAIAVVVITLAGLVLYLMKATPSEPAPAAAGSQAPATVSQPPAVTPPATLRAEGPAPATQPADRPVTPQTPPEAEPAAARQSAARNPATRGASTPAGRPNPALTPRGGSPVPAEPAAAPAAPEPPPIARVGRDGVAVPRRIATAEPQYPPAALAARTRATVKLELTIGREGRVADARVVTSAGNGFDQAALAAARRWEFAPTYVDGKPVPVIYPVDVDFVPPEPEPAPAATKPAAPAAATPPPSTQPSAPAARPAINDQALIVQALKQYEAAWEALDADALARVQVLSSSEAAAVRRTMADAENYSMDVVVQNITIDPKGQAATVRATVTRNFRAKAFNRSERVALPTTMQLQKRGDSWVITGMR